MGTNGWLFGTLIASMGYTLSCTRWDRMMVDHNALKGLNDHYWNELDDMQRRTYFKDFEVRYGCIPREHGLAVPDLARLEPQGVGDWAGHEGPNA